MIIDRIQFVEKPAIVEGYPGPHRGTACPREMQRGVACSGGLAHLALQVVGKTDLVDQLQLGFQEVDVLFGVVQDLL